MGKNTKDIETEIKRIEEEIRTTEYNKATQYHIGKLKAKLAKLRTELEKARTKKAGGVGYAIKKSGDATVALVGYPSVGKSTLLNKLTGAKSTVAPYEFTTINIVPGILRYNGAEMQVLDLPGIIEGAHKGKGRGREVISAIRSSDLVVIITDIYSKEIDIILNEMYEGGIRINKTRPDIRIKKLDRGGIEVYSTVKLTKLDETMVRSILNENGIVNATVVLRGDYGVDELIDALMGNRVYINGIIALNKIDLCEDDSWMEIKKLLEERHNLRVYPISAEKEVGIEELKGGIFKALGFIKIYMKPQGKDVDYNAPMIVRKGTTIEGVCKRIHKSFLQRFRYARIWGDSVKFPGQRVGLDHAVMDGDIVTIVLEKE